MLVIGAATCEELALAEHKGFCMEMVSVAAMAHTRQTTEQAAHSCCSSHLIKDDRHNLKVVHQNVSRGGASKVPVCKAYHANSGSTQHINHHCCAVPVRALLDIYAREAARDVGTETALEKAHTAQQELGLSPDAELVEQVSGSSHTMQSRKSSRKSPRQ